MGKEHIIYRYVCDGETIYVGKTDSSLKQRIDSHAREEKFQPYLKNAQIEYFKLNNSAETTFWETYLINKYHGKLNVTDNYTETALPDIQIPEWHNINDYHHKKNRKNILSNAKATSKEKIKFCLEDLGEIPFSSGKNYIARVAGVPTLMHRWILNYVLIQCLKNNFTSYSYDIDDYKVTHNICVFINKARINDVCNKFDYSNIREMFKAINMNCFYFDCCGISGGSLGYTTITTGASLDVNGIYIHINDDLLKTVYEMTGCSFLDMAYEFLCNEAGIEVKKK